MNNLSSTATSVNHNDLVILANGTPVTTSLLVAQVFDKSHKNIIRAIKNIDCSPPFTERNFALSNYTDSTGRSLPMYTITRDGFTFLGMGFRGKMAAKFKEAYIADFNRMEQILRQRQSSEYRKAREEGKIARRAETDMIHNFVDYAKMQGSKNAHFYYVNLTRMAYHALGFQQTHKPVRDMLTPQETAILTLMEAAISETIDVGIKKEDHYKDIFLAVKARVYGLATALAPAVQLLAA